MISLDCNLLKKVFLFLIILLCVSCSRKKAEEEAVVSEGENTLYEDFYCPDYDDAAWVESIVEQTFEEIAALQIDELMEIESIIKSPYSVSSNEVEFVEKRFADTNRRLKAMEYGEEVFIPVEKSNELIFINKYKNHVVRDFYNTDYKLYKKEIWDMSQQGSEKKVLTQEFFYGEGNKPIRQINTSEGKKAEYYWQFDDKGRVTLEQETILEKGIYTSKTQIYTFNADDEIPANYEYWENNEIKIKTIYSDKTHYTNQVFFEEDFSVITEYENGEKKKETYIQDNEVVREREY